jgi:hypothetical protein
MARRLPLPTAARPLVPPQVLIWNSIKRCSCIARVIRSIAALNVCPRCRVNVCLVITRVSKRYSGSAIVCCTAEPALHAASSSAAAGDFQAFKNNNNLLNVTTQHLHHALDCCTREGTLGRVVTCWHPSAWSTGKALSPARGPIHGSQILRTESSQNLVGILDVVCAAMRPFL